MPPKATLSQERVHDSTEDESSSSEEETTLRPAINGTNASSTVKASISSEVESDKSDGQSDAESDDSSSSKTSTSSRSSSASNVATKRKANGMSGKISEPPTKKSKNSSNEMVRRVEASRYAPPQGYAAVTPAASGKPDRSSAIFNNLEGKQIWHITAPANVPLSKIQSIDLSKVLNGGPILEYKDISYTMTRADINGAAALVPNKATAEYTPASVGVSRAFHIRELAKTPNDQPETPRNGSKTTNSDSSETGRLTFFATQTGSNKLPRKQPENLKARYVPYGVPVNKPQIPDQPTTGVTKDKTTTEPIVDLSDTSAESENEKPKPGFSAASESSKSKPEAPSPDAKSAKKSRKQRNTSDEMDVDIESTPAKEPSVRSTPKSAAKSAVRNTDAMDVDVVETPISKTKASHKSAATVSIDSLTGDKIKTKKDKKKKVAV